MNHDSYKQEFNVQVNTQDSGFQLRYVGYKFQEFIVIVILSIAGSVNVVVAWLIILVVDGKFST